MTLDPDLPTLPGAFSAAGYETCLVGKMHLDGNRQYVGFNHRPYGDLTGGQGHQYDPPTPKCDRGYGPSTRRIGDAGVTEIPESQLQERKVIDETLAFLREHRHETTDQPWFLCASFSRPHFPLTAPSRFFDEYWPDGVTEPKISHEDGVSDHPLVENVYQKRQFGEIDPGDEQRARAAYFSAVSFLDELVGDLLAALDRNGFLDETVVVYASDHGELAGEHGLWWKQTYHEAATRIPLYFQLPGHRSGEISSSTLTTPVSLIDLFPTVVSLTGVDVPAGLDGKSLAPAVRSGEEPDREPVVSDNLNERWGTGTEFRMVRDGDHKYVRVRGHPDLLFDLSADPFETANLINERPALAERLREYVDQTLDFEAVQREREHADRGRASGVDVPAGTSGNAYRLPDGWIVDADTPLYAPSVLVEDPSNAFADYPGE